jgi:hypothetical protein
VPSAFSGTVYSLVGANTTTGPRIIAGGSFTAGSAVNVGAYDWATGTWSNVGTGVDAAVRALGLVTDDDGSHLYATGDFLNAGGNPCFRLARFDGADWVPAQATSATAPIMLNAPGHVISVPQSDGSGEVYIAGQFSSIDLGATIDVHIVALSPCCPDLFITAGPVTSTATLSGTHTFSVTATSANPLTYQWKKNGQDIPGATSSSYTFTVTASDFLPTEFSVCVSNGCATVCACPVHLRQVSIVDLGGGCCSGASGPAPTLTLSSAAIGSPFTITVAPVPPGATVVTYISGAGYPAITLCGCSLFLDPLNHAEIPAVADAAGTMTLSGTIPNLPGYHGVMQAVVIYPNCIPPACPIPFCFCITNAVELILG